MTGTSRLHHVIKGDPAKPVVVLLHGFMGSAWDWHDVMDLLARDSFCVAVDLPGHGKTGASPASAYSMDGAGALVVELLDRLGIAPCNLLGYSMGGRLALHLALRDPGRFTSLILESSSPGIEDPADCLKRKDEDERLAQRLEAGDFNSLLRDWYAQPMFDGLRSQPERFEKLLVRRRQNNPAELARSLRGLGVGAQASLWSRLGDLRMPVLMVAGERDPKYVEIARRVTVLCPAAQSTMVTDSGHHVHAENVDLFVQAVSEFLKANQRGMP